MNMAAVAATTGAWLARSQVIRRQAPRAARSARPTPVRRPDPNPGRRRQVDHGGRTLPPPSGPPRRSPGRWSVEVGHQALAIRSPQGPGEGSEPDRRRRAHVVDRRDPIIAGTQGPREAPARRKVTAAPSTATTMAVCPSAHTGETSAVIRLLARYSTVLTAPACSAPLREVAWWSASPLATPVTASKAAKNTRYTGRAIRVGWRWCPWPRPPPRGRAEADGQDELDEVDPDPEVDVVAEVLVDGLDVGHRVDQGDAHPCGRRADKEGLGAPGNVGRPAPTRRAERRS